MTSTAYLIAMFKPNGLGIPIFESVGIYSERTPTTRQFLVSMEILRVTGTSFADARNKILEAVRTDPFLAWLQHHMRALLR